MKERPILMSAPMVRAILSDTKTQTRRVAKIGATFGSVSVGHYSPAPEEHVPPVFGALFRNNETGADQLLSSPYGQPGDRLWVREAFAKNEVLPVEHRASGGWIYRADLNDRGVTRYSARWTPSIHMPRAASRLTLEITDVRVERLNDISEADARAEGVTLKGGQGYEGWAKQEYMALWESINGPCSWAMNPWVWVVEFRRVAP